MTPARSYRLAMFDFDGTLADSFPFFASTLDTLAERYHFGKIRSEELETLRECHPREVMAHVGMPIWKLPFVAARFVAMMRDSAGSILPFRHTHETLEFLHTSGVTLAVITSNSHENVATILGPHTCALLASLDCGTSIFGKAARIRAMLKTTGFAAEDAIYVGDQLADLEAARDANVAFGAVAWGYGNITSMRRHSPEEEFLEMQELRRIAQGS